MSLMLSLPSPENPQGLPDQKLAEWLEDELRKCLGEGATIYGDLFYELAWSGEKVLVLLSLLAKVGRYFTHEEMAEFMGVAGERNGRLQALRDYTEFMEYLAGARVESRVTIPAN
jgi:hypothetical protein